MLEIDATALIIFALVWVLVLVLGRVFFKPITRVMREREARVAGDRDAARKALAETGENLKRIEERIREARAEAAAAREKAEIDAQRERARLLQETGAEARAQLDRAKAELQAEIERLKAELDARAGDLAADIERKVMPS